MTAARADLDEMRGDGERASTCDDCCKHLRGTPGRRPTARRWRSSSASLGMVVPLRRFALEKAMRSEQPASELEEFLRGT